MSRAGDVTENPVTGERAVARLRTEETRGERLVVDLFVRPGGAVVGKHLHSQLEERFTVLSGFVLGEAREVASHRTRRAAQHRSRLVERR